MKGISLLQKREETKKAKEMMKECGISSKFIIKKKTEEEIRDLQETEERIKVTDILKEIKSGKTVEDILRPREFVDLSPPKEENLSVVETHSINEPYAFVRILFDNKGHEYIYEVMEPNIEEREIFDFLKDTLIKTLNINLEEFSSGRAREFLRKYVNKIIQDYSISLDDIQKEKIMYCILRDFLGYGKIDVLMKDPMIEDISCDTAGIPIYLYHRNYENIRTNVVFESDAELDSFVIKLAQKCGRHISIARPLMDATMPDGSRIQAALSREVTSRGSTFTIRRFREEPFTPPDLVEYNTLSPEIAAYFWLAIENGASAIYVGGTASGKTTTLNALSLFIPPQMKIVSIEDTREINLPHPNWIASITRVGTSESGEESSIDMFDLLKSALRQRPEYILLGEIRGKEASVLFQAMATGHTVYSTMHADSIHSVVHRLEGNPINIPRIQLQSLDIVAIQALMKIKKKRVRKIQKVIEVIGIDPSTNEILTNEVFSWNPGESDFEYYGEGYLFDRIMEQRNLSERELLKEFEQRSDVIKWMREKGIKNYIDVGEIIAAYYKYPEEILKRMEE